MKFLHTADLHVGALRNLIPADYITRSATALAEIHAIARRLDVRCLVVSGDLLHFKSVREAERNLVMEWLCTLSEDGIRVLAINGNHDILGEGQGTTLRPVSMLAKRLDQCTVVESEPTLVKHAGVTFALVPPQRRHDLSTTESCRRINAYLNENKLSDAVVVTHLTVAGCKTETGHMMAEGAKIGSKRVRYWALGDIHRMQSVSANAYYPGNPLHHRWGEQGKKGVLVVDTEAPESPVFVTMKAATPLLTCHGSKSLAETVAKAPNSYIRLVAPYQDVPSVLPAQVLAVEPLRAGVEAGEDADEAEDRPRVDRRPMALVDAVTQALESVGIRGGDLDTCTRFCKRVLKVG